MEGSKATLGIYNRQISIQNQLLASTNRTQCPMPANNQCPGIIAHLLQLSQLAIRPGHRQLGRLILSGSLDKSRWWPIPWLLVMLSLRRRIPRRHCLARASGCWHCVVISLRLWFGDASPVVIHGRLLSMYPHGELGWSIVVLLMGQHWLRHVLLWWLVGAVVVLLAADETEPG